MLVDNHPVITPRVIRCNHSIKHIIKHALRVLPALVTVTTAPRQIKSRSKGGFLGS